jgi:hypothetical protein
MNIYYSLLSMLMLITVSFSHFFPVSRLMGGSAGGMSGHMSNMSNLAACSLSDTKPIQFPLAQRRKRRVLFTQAQVSIPHFLPI